jgi:hypothetical protein
VLGVPKDGVALVETLARGAFHYFNVKRVTLLGGEELSFVQDDDALRIDVRGVAGPFAVRIQG